MGSTSACSQYLLQSLFNHPSPPLPMQIWIMWVFNAQRGNGTLLLYILYPSSGLINSWDNGLMVAWIRMVPSLSYWKPISAEMLTRCFPVKLKWNTLCRWRVHGTCTLQLFLLGTVSRVLRYALALSISAHPPPLQASEAASRFQACLSPASVRLVSWLGTDQENWHS